MGLFDWLKKRQSGDDGAVLLLDKDEEHLAGLDLKQVIDAHLAWRTRLQDILAGIQNEKVEVHQVAQDTLCVLGKWLYGEGKAQFSNLHEYEDLRLTHRQFHLTAGQILTDHNAGQADTAASLLKGDFRSLSDRIQLDLVRLYAAAK